MLSSNLDVAQIAADLGVPMRVNGLAGPKPNVRQASSTYLHLAYLHLVWHAPHAHGSKDCTTCAEYSWSFYQGFKQILIVVPGRGGSVFEATTPQGRSSPFGCMYSVDVYLHLVQFGKCNMASRNPRSVTAGSDAAAKPANDMGKIVEPSAINSTPIRVLTMLAAFAAAGYGTSILPGAAVAIAHVMASGIWLGVNIWTTFFSGITMMKNLERQTFGRLQSKLFPLCGPQTKCCIFCVERGPRGSPGGLTHYAGPKWK
jgi:hypothetical protein